MDKRDRQIVHELRSRLPLEIQGRVRKLIVFGSRAREEGDENSDLDVVALVDEKTGGLEEILDGIAYSTMWDYDFKPILSLKVFSESHFRDMVKRGFSFYRHVEQEGIAL
jgi:predicted nucleotidyltransferase